MGEETYTIPVNITVRKEGDSIKPWPGYLHHSLVGNKTPRVILPDGNLLGGVRYGKGDGEFNDATAKLVAEKTDGLYFPSNLEDHTFMLTEYIEALRRVVPNLVRENSSIAQWNLYAAASRKNSFADLTRELKYLDGVKLLVTKEGRERCARSTGELEGIVHTRKGECDTKFGPEGIHGYEIALALYLGHGFGDEHLQIPRRKLSADINAWHDFNRNSNEVTAIQRFVSSIEYETEWKDKKYSLSVDFLDSKGKSVRLEEDISTVKLSMVSPNHTPYDARGLKVIREHPAMKTPSMLRIFRKIADRIANGIAKTSDAKHKREKQAQEDCEKEMGLFVE